MGSKSSSKNQTTSNFYDNRQVNDAGGGVIGSGNRLDNSINLTDRSVTSTTTRNSTDNSINLLDRSTSNTSTRTSTTTDNSLRYNDSSDRSVRTTTDNSLRYNDSSDRSQRTSYTDNSRTSYTVTDSGAVQAAQAIAIKGLDAGTKGQAEAVKFATKAQNDAASFNAAAVSRVFDLAGASQAAVAKSNSEALGFARDTLNEVTDYAREVSRMAKDQAQAFGSGLAGAYQSAADTNTGNKTLIYAALAAVAVVGVAMAFKG